MIRKNVLPLPTIAALMLGGLTATAADKVIEKSKTGKAPVKSINVITFADEGVLLIGDGTGSQIVAVETGDTKSAKRFSGKIEGFDKQVAARLGTTPKGISLVDLAVNPASGKIYVAVRSQAARGYVVLTVDGAGKISEFPLEKVTYAAVQLSAGNVRISRISDVAYADGRILAAGRGTGTFASKIFSINAPLSDGSEGTIVSAETYHVSHRRWETRAPMSVLVPYKEGDKTYVVGAFACTPVVKFPVDNITNDAKVKGISMIELGSGNRPLDMLVYEKGKKAYVLANTYRFHKPFSPSRYWTVRFEQGLLAGDKKVNETAIRRLKGSKPATPRITMVDTFHGVIQMDKLDEKTAAVIREGNEGVSLEAVALP